MNPYPVLLLVAALLVTDCAQQQKINPNLSDYNLNQPLTRFAPYDEGYPLTDAPYDSAAPYKTEEYIQYWSDFYKEKKNPPPFHYDMNLSGKTFHELRLLRAEILARHGFLFMDYVLRSHFNATDWYRPVFWYNDFRIKLNTKEKQFIAMC